MWVKVDYSTEAKKNPCPNMAGEYAIYVRKHWWNKWVEKQTFADLIIAEIEAERLVKLPIYFHSNWY